MDSDNHGYIPDDVDFDGLLNNPPVWPNTTDQYGFQQHQSQQQQQQQQQQQHMQQDPYARYSTNQPSYGQQYDLSHQQPSYNSLSYSNDPGYTTQYQHARPSDMFGPTSYNLDPSMQEPNSYHGAQSSFPYQLTTTQHPTISPQTLQYNMLAQQQLNTGIGSATFQRSNSGIGNKPDYNYGQRAQSNDNHFFSRPQNGILPQKMTQNVSNNTIRYPSLAPDLGSNEEAKKHVPLEEKYPVVAPATIAAPHQRDGSEYRLIAPANPLRVTHPDLVANNASSRPRLSYAPFVAWEDTPIQVAPGLKNTIPKYYPRKSRSGKELVVGLNKSKILTSAKVSQKIRVPKKKKTHVSTYKGTGRSAFDKDFNARADGTNTPIKSPSTPTESSSSEEETSSEEESDYEDDEEEEMPPPVDISTVRELTRPNDIPSAARWDAIGIVWKDPNSSPSAAAITSAMNDYANAVSALRVQIKDVAAKIEEATTSKVPEAQLQKLKDLRAEQSDALYQTLDAAIKLGYGSIVENLGGHQKLVSGLTATLIECTKSDDYLGKLPRAVFALLARFQTLTEELLKKSKFDALARRWNKKGDSEIKGYIKTIMESTTDAKGRASKTEKDIVNVEETKKRLEKVEEIKSRAAETAKPTAAIPSSKRPHDGDSNNGKPNKKFATDVSGTPTSTPKLPPIPKRSTQNNLLGISSKPTPKPTPKVAPPKKKEPSPPMSSRLGDILASIEKPPEPPQKAAPAAGPPETPEEKKRRERKESRRHLRVKFKPDNELEQIRLFKHEVAEDEGRQDNMLRDAHNNHSEGMMHKQRVKVTDDEDDESTSAMIEDRPYPTLIEVDLSNLDKHTTYGPSYITRGGNVKFVTPEQQVQERREANELLVIYNDPSEIPPSAKEPSAANNAASGMVRQLKYPNAPWLIQRLHDIHQYGPEYARTLSISRLEERKYKEMRDNQARGFSQNASSSNGVPSVLQQIGGVQQNKLNMDAAAWENLQRIVASLKGKPYPATEPPEWMNEAQKNDWWEGYNKDHPNAAEERLIAQLQAPQAPPAPPMMSAIPVSQMQSYQPQMSQPVMSYQVAVPDVNQQVQQYLASLTGNNNMSGDGTSSSTPQQFDFSAWANNPALKGYGPALSNDGASLRQWGTGYQNDENRDSRPKNTNYNDNWKGKKGSAWKNNTEWKKDSKYEPLDENGQYKGKKQPCKFWGEGKCAKGAACTYSHEPEDQGAGGAGSGAGRDRY
ncbi:hypothetical protein EYC80_007218 [Monilinia laxa]|uniref:C3H1-type domain-containing protein n=1 Tax=Monilinia laxa TaxID=61186 RepID=A0A5N6K0I9_MONLA|nr:hypothetical protein EYC80_007218 [Monilinia laxa]